MTKGESMQDNLDKWSFNVMLECESSPEAQLMVGGIVEGLTELRDVLLWAQGKISGRD